MHERTTDAAETAVPLPEPQGRSYTPGASEQGRAMTSVEAGRARGRPRASSEPFGRADRYIVGLLATLVGSVIIGFVTIGGQLLAMERRIGGFRTEMHQEIGGLRTEMHKEIGGLRTEMREEIGKLSDRVDQLSDRTDQLSDRVDQLSDRMGQLSDRMGQLSDRMTRVETLIETHLVPASNARDPAGP